MLSRSLATGFMGSAARAISTIIPNMPQHFKTVTAPKGVDPVREPLETSHNFSSDHRNDPEKARVHVVAEVKGVKFIEEGRFAGHYYLTIKPERISNQRLEDQSNATFGLLTHTPFKTGEVAIFTSVLYATLSDEKLNKISPQTIFVAKEVVREPN